MNDKLKTTGLLVGGYMLGRSKKTKLIFTVAASAAGAAAYNRRDLIAEALRKASANTPDLQGLSEKVSGRLADSMKNAAYSAASQRVQQLNQKLQDQTENINRSLDETTEATDGQDKPEISEEQEEPAAEDEEDEAAEDELEQPAGDEDRTAERSNSAPSSPSGPLTLAKGESKAVREWARENGYEVSARGRIRNDVVKAYREAVEGS